jgi:sterol desaturase/sphingolipid hydroxylase (fatty acid hydroxylase superfamily)
MSVFHFASVVLPVMIFLPLEYLLAARPTQPVFRRGWFTDVTYVLVNRLLIALGLAAVIGIVTMSARGLLPPRVHTALASQPIWFQVVQIFLIADLGFYMAHRAFHTVPGLWRFHAIHHSIVHLDWLAAARVHPIDQIVTKAVSLLPVFILGYSDASLGLFAIVYFWHSLLLHSNVTIGFGPLNRVVASPRFHQWHHANDRAAHDKNFAAQLSIIDRLFGTYYVPDHAPARFGTDDAVPRSYLRNLTYPLRLPTRSAAALTAAASR